MPAPREAGYVLLRLPLELKELFREWLAHRVPRPRRARHQHPALHARRQGLHAASGASGSAASGPYAEQIGARFRLATKRLGLNERNSKLRTDLFRRPVAARAASSRSFDIAPAIPQSFPQQGEAIRGDEGDLRAGSGRARAARRADRRRRRGRPRAAGRPGGGRRRRARSRTASRTASPTARRSTPGRAAPSTSTSSGLGPRRHRRRRRRSASTPTTSCKASLWAMAQAVAAPGLPAQARAHRRQQGAAARLRHPRHRAGRRQVPLDRRRLHRRQGDARRHDGRARPRLPPLRLRPPQGLRHARASRRHRQRYGVTPHHRRSFRPVQLALGLV